MVGGSPSRKVHWRVHWRRLASVNNAVSLGATIGLWQLFRFTLITSIFVWFVFCPCLLFVVVYLAHLHIWLLTLVITSMNKPKFVHPSMKGFVIILRKYLRSMNQK